MKKIATILLLVLFIGFAGFKAFTRISGKSSGSSGRRYGRGPVAVAVETEDIRLDTINDTGTFTGTVTASSQYNVAPRISGRLRRLAVDIGDSIKPGDLIALMDDEEHKQAVDQSAAEVAVAKANMAQASSSLNNASLEFERVKGLRAKGIASESEFDTAKAKVEAQQAQMKVAEAQLQQREAALRAAKVRLSYTRIEARWEGSQNQRIIGERFVDEGATLPASSPIVSVIDLDYVTVIIYVTERDYTRIKPGQNAIVSSDALPEISFEGKVARVAPLLKESSRQARVEITVENPDHALKPGMFARAEMLFGVHHNAILVPKESIADRNGETGVFVIDNDGPKASFTAVETGFAEGNYIEIKAPELKGKVVTLGLHLLENNSPVILPESSANYDKKKDKGGSQ